MTRTRSKGTSEVKQNKKLKSSLHVQNICPEPKGKFNVEVQVH